MLSLAVSLWDLFKGRAFLVADYQRPFAWTSQQMEDLWKDLADNALTSRRHFMGTVIVKLVPQRDSRAPYKTYEIVDGQQRLTSLVTMVATACRRLWMSPEFGSLARQWYENLVCAFLNGRPDGTLRKMRLGGLPDIEPSIGQAACGGC